MKKQFISAAAAVIFLSAAVTPVFADNDYIVYVTITTGNNVLAAKEVRLKDVDGDDGFTVWDALYCAHEQYYKKGSSGCAYRIVDDEMQLAKLWGVSGSKFGCFLNTYSVYSLDDQVWDGDYIDAFKYTDEKGFSDVYAYFDEMTVEAETGDEISLYLSGSYYDSDNELVENEIAGAEILVNGKRIGARTDDYGEAVFRIDQAGISVISAEKDGVRLVPPICTAVITRSERSGSDDTASVYVSIANGRNVLAAQEIVVTDMDMDGELTVKDALLAAHGRYFGGGTSGCGFISVGADVFIGKLWGIDARSFGCYLNNRAVESATGPISDGDVIDAFVFTDQARLSDVYSYFDDSFIETEAGKEVSLILTGSFYNEDMDLVEAAVVNAEIVVNGRASGVRTGMSGEATVTVDSPGISVISARSDNMILVPPVCRVMAEPAPVTSTAPSAPIVTTTPPETTVQTVSEPDGTAPSETQPPLVESAEPESSVTTQVEQEEPAAETAETSVPVVSSAEPETEAAPEPPVAETSYNGTVILIAVFASAAAIIAAIAVIAAVRAKKKRADEADN